MNEGSAVPAGPIQTTPPNGNGGGPPGDTGYPGGATPAGSGPYGTGKPSPSGFDWERYLSVLQRNKWLIIAVTLVGTLLGVGAAYFVSPQYVAQATLFIEWENRPNQRADRGPIQQDELLESYNWVELLRSYAVLEHVARQERLFLRPESAQDTAGLASFQVAEGFTPGSYRVEVNPSDETWVLVSGDSARVDQGSLGDSIGRRLGFRWAPPGDVLVQRSAWQFELDHPRDAARTLGEQLEARMLERGNFLRLELAGDDPAQTASIVNSLVGRFVELASDLKRAKVEELETLLADQLQSAEENLEEAETELEEYRVATATQPTTRSSSEGATGVGASASGTNPLAGRYQELRLRRDDLAQERRMIQRALAGTDSAAVRVGFLESIPSAQTSSALTDAVADLTTKRAELRTLTQVYSDEHPDVQAVRAEIRDLESQTIPGLAREVGQRLADRENEVERELASMGGQLRQMPERATREARLERRVVIAEDLYSRLKSRHEEARLAAASAVPDVRVLDEAQVAGEPLSDPRPKLVALAFLGSLGLVVMGTLLFDRLDSRIRYPAQVSHEMGVNILGTVPHLKTPRGGHLSVEDASKATESFRTIRLNLSHAFGSAGPLITTVTSPGEGDGKSFVSLNLALTFARLGKSTLLIDGDIRRGRLHRALNRARRLGLTDYLTGDADEEAVIKGTPYPSVDFIPTGTIRETGPELLQSRAMRDLIASVRSRYEVIIVDSPPLGAGVDPLVLSTFTGHMTMVVRAGSTNQGMAQAKLDSMTPLPVRLLGAVLNDVPSSAPYQYYQSYLPGYEATDETMDEATTKLLHTG